MPDRCDTCRWWGGERAHDDNMPLGSCHARPPSQTQWRTQQLETDDVLAPLFVFRAEWPWTAFDDFCGGHKHKDTPDAD